MTENSSQGPSLIKLGKLANGKDFEKLENLWLEALNHPQYTWRELLPIAGQVGRQGAPDRADILLEMLTGWVEERKGAENAFEAVCKAAGQLPGAKGIRPQLKRLYLKRFPDFSQLPVLLGFLLTEDANLDETVKTLEFYVQLQPGFFAASADHLVPGQVETLDPETGLLGLRFGERRSEFEPRTVHKLSPRPLDHFPSLMIYHPDRLRDLADQDPVEFIKLALAASRENRVGYREFKNSVTELLGEKGWKDWWKTAKPALKHDPMISMSSGSQPSIRMMRRADKYEDRLRRGFENSKTNLDKLLKVMTYLDEVSREQKQSNGEEYADEDLLLHFGNGVAKVAVASLTENPTLALAGLALHAEVAARGVAVARPNPRAAAQVLKKIPDPGSLGSELPEGLLHRVLQYLRQAEVENWGEVWSGVLLKTGKRMCDVVTRGLLEGGQEAALTQALLTAVDRPTSSPDLLCWLWRTRHTSGTAGRFLAGLEDLPDRRIAAALFNLLDSTGKLYGMSLEEKHLKLLETARSALSIQAMRPLLALIDEGDRKDAAELKSILENNAGVSAAQKTQLLGYLRSRYADLFMELTREWEEGGTIYTTEDGLRQSQDALNFIIETEIPEVARQIGEAASHGDLSENAEYTAALEKRDQLASRATRMENELSMAKVINHEMAGSDFVNIGTRVQARSLESDQEETFTFLGPWDTDVERKVLNYQAPLAMTFMGARVGDTVEFGEGTQKRSWTILAIAAAV